jgi:hypothetical protein
MSENRQRKWLNIKEASKMGIVIGLFFIFYGVAQLVREKTVLWIMTGYPSLFAGAIFLYRSFRPNFTFLKQLCLFVFGPLIGIGLSILIDSGVRLLKGGNIEAAQGASTAGLVFVLISVLPIWYAVREGDSGRLFREE